MSSTPPKLAFGVEPSTRRFRLRLSRYQALAETIAAWVRAHPGGNGGSAGRSFDLLDVGVGNGRTRRYLESHPEAERVRLTGVDLSERRLAAVWGREAWSLARCDAERGLPFVPESFDLIVCEQVLEHLERPERLLAEMARVARPGALLVAGVPTFPPGVHLVRRTLVPFADRLRGVRRGHAQVFTLGSFSRLIESTGQFRVRGARGFRIVSGGPTAPLEDLEAWWRLNRWVGERLPWLCTEVQVVAERVA